MMEPLEPTEFPLRPCLGGCGAEVPAVELYGNVFPMMCVPCRLAAEQAEAWEQRTAHVDLLLGRTKVGSRIRAWSLDTYPKDKVAKAAKAAGVKWLDGYRAGSRAGLNISGPVGSGKTGLAWGLVRALIEEDLVEANLVNFRDLLAEIRESFNNKVRGDLWVKRVPVLFLDDLGAERPTDWALDELATLIEWRYQRELPTCSTSNYSPSELAKRLGHDDVVVGQRIVSRLTDDAVALRVDGSDRRRS